MIDEFLCPVLPYITLFEVTAICFQLFCDFTTCYETSPLTVSALCLKYRKRFTTWTHSWKTEVKCMYFRMIRRYFIEAPINKFPLIIDSSIGRTIDGLFYIEQISYSCERTFNIWQIYETGHNDTSLDQMFRLVPRAMINNTWNKCKNYVSGLVFMR